MKYSLAAAGKSVFSSAVAIACLFSLTLPVVAQDSCEITINGETYEPDMSKGKRAFLRCRACHSLKPGEPHKVGPNLGLIFLRDANGADGYAYSDAFEAGAVNWTPDTLDSFIENPRKFLPGSKMLFAGIPSASERASLIAFLRSATNPDFSCEGES